MRKAITSLIITILLIATSIALGLLIYKYILATYYARSTEPKIRLVDMSLYYNYTFFSISIEWDRPFNVTIENANGSNPIVCLYNCVSLGNRAIASCSASCRIDVNAMYSRSIFVIVSDKQGNSFSKLISAR